MLTLRVHKPAVETDKNKYKDVSTNLAQVNKQWMEIKEGEWVVVDIDGTRMAFLEK